MKLIIAEKPSVAQSIAAAIGATQKQTGYIEGNGYLVSWCVGHLITSKMPEDYDPELKAWKLETLPLLPSPFEMKVSYQTRKQYLVLKELMQRSDVESLVCATDAGREGELIFRLVYNQAKCKRPFQRLWVSSMEESAILDALKCMKDGHEYDNLYQAARCRQMADWYVGINFSRLYSCLYSANISVGRVQTPTVNLIVQRQRDIDSFTPIPYYVLSADFGGFCGDLRFDDKLQAETAKNACTGKQGIVMDVVKTEKKDKPPELYDLTSLQRDANQILGYTAQQTLDYIQSLYDKKLATYPRTDSRYLTEDMTTPTVTVISHLKNLNIAQGLTNYSMDHVQIGQVINNKKVSDHHAIIPTKQVTEENFAELPSGERNILLLLFYRLLAAVYPPHLYISTKTTVAVGDYVFSATAKEVLQDGWKAIERLRKNSMSSSAENDSEQKESTKSITLPPLEKNMKLDVSSLEIEAKKTKPPAAYTDATLLSAMESVGKDIEDESLREAMKGGGLGTPATRAETIEKIIKTGYVERKGKKLLPTEKAYTFIDLVHEQVKSPEMTAQWEMKLSEIERGEASEDSFLRDIRAFVTEFTQSQVSSAKVAENKHVFKTERATIGKCPVCGMDVKEYSKTYSCSSGKEGCGFLIWKRISGKDISTAQAKKLLAKKKTDIIKGFVSKRTGKPYEAYLVLGSDHKVGFEFAKRK